MNKPRAAAYRKPATTPAILAAIQHTTAWPTIAGSTQIPTIPRAALEWSSCLTSGPTLPPLGSTQRGPLYDPVATLMGTHPPQTAQRAQIPVHVGPREFIRREPACAKRRSRSAWQPAATPTGTNQPPPRTNPHAT